MNESELVSVMSGKAQSEQMFSGLAPAPGIQKRGCHFGSRPRAVVSFDWRHRGHRAPPSARMCKRCSLLTKLLRDRAEVSLFQWRKRGHIYRVGAVYAALGAGVVASR